MLQLFLVEKLKPYVYKVNVFTDEETNIFEVYYIVFVRNLIPSFLARPRRKCVQSPDIILVEEIHSIN